jgi:hypothetical protein
VRETDRLVERNRLREKKRDRETKYFKIVRLRLVITGRQRKLEIERDLGKER